jgi:hypothetical protein
MPLHGKSLSGHERNRVFLNVSGAGFVEISALTQADSQGDGRSAVAGDFTGDGMVDLIVRQSGGGPFMLYENRFPRKPGLSISLSGTRSQRQGIGARVVAEVGGRKIVREMYPPNGFMSQGPARVQFGLAGADKADKLTIHWPSGLVQELRDVPANHHLRIQEGNLRAEAR